VRVWLISVLLPVLALAAENPEQLYRDGRKAEKAGELVRAYLLYSEAAAADPNNTTYWSHAMALRPVASLQAANTMKVTENGLAEPRLNPDITGSITDRELDEARQPLPPVEFNGLPGHQNFDLRGDAKQLFEQVAKAFGLRVLFDEDYQPSAPKRFQLEDAGYREAFRALEAATGSFIEPVSERMLFVANDTAQKRVEFQHTASAAIPIPDPLTVQEIQEIVTGVRGLLDIQRMLVDTQRRMVLVRDRASKVQIATVLFRDLMQRRPQVAIDVEILAADESSSLHYGLSLQSAVPLVWFGMNPKNIMTTIPAGFMNFMTFGGGASLFGLGVTASSLFGTVSKSSATSILEAKMVSLDGQPATLHVGQRYPIASNLYIGNTGGSGQVFTPPPTFSFEDLGLVLKITPHVNGMDDVSLDVNAEFKLLGAAAVNGIPVIANREYESKVRVRQGEWAVLAGLMNASEARTVTGIVGLAKIPFLRETQRNRDRSDTLIVLKPRLLSLPPTEFLTHEAWVGTETRPRSDM
jgi:general secretion pathway protein D